MMNTQQQWWCRWFEQQVDSGYLDQLIRPSNACQVEHTRTNATMYKWVSDLSHVSPQWSWKILFTWWQFLVTKSSWSNVRTTSRSQSAFRGGGYEVTWQSAPDPHEDWWQRIRNIPNVHFNLTIQVWTVMNYLTKVQLYLLNVTEPSTAPKVSVLQVVLTSSSHQLHQFFSHQETNSSSWSHLLFKLKSWYK